MSTAAQTSGDTAVYWDPYRPDLGADPYPTYQRMRAEAPVYYNKDYDFHAVSRFADVEAVLTNHETFISGRTDILEFIRSDIEIPKGMFIWNDPPVHGLYRSVLMRAFTPRRMNEIEQLIRDYCVRCLDPIVGREHFDFITDYGAILPGGVIGMLLGIPDEEREKVRDRVEDSLRTETGKPMEVSQASYQGGGFEEYVDWRAKNPSDDLMTELLTCEFTDDTGTKRKLTRDEVLVFVNLLAGAGNDTTSRLIGWVGKLLGDHPDQRRQVAADLSLVPQAMEEMLRMEPPGPAVGRYVAHDVEIAGTRVPEGSVMLALIASANRDESRFSDGERFNIHRKGATHITFGRGVHSCLGMALARVEGRVAIEELLKRFPDWELDMANAKLSSSSTTRGWDNLPARLR